MITITAPGHDRHHEPGRSHASACLVLEQYETVKSSRTKRKLRLSKVKCFDQSHTALKGWNQGWLLALPSADWCPWQEPGPWGLEGPECH